MLLEANLFFPFLRGEVRYRWMDYYHSIGSYKYFPKILSSANRQERSVLHLKTSSGLKGREAWMRETLGDHLPVGRLPEGVRAEQRERAVTPVN
jgi:hypothetical protein